jgi:hypothetical protein
LLLFSTTVYWKQDIDLRYEPELVIDSSDRSFVPFKLHFQKQVSVYGKNVIVNLVKSKGAEKPLGDIYEQMSQKLNDQNVKYVAFDVYKYCGSTNFSKLSILFDQMKEDLNTVGFFSIKNKQPEKKQTEIFRTNCKGKRKCGERRREKDHLENLILLFLF